MQRSRTYSAQYPNEAAPFPETRFVARDTNATNLPSPLMATFLPAFPLGALPSGARSTATVFATQFAAPTQVSRTKTFPGVAGAIRFLASE